MSKGIAMSNNPGVALARPGAVGHGVTLAEAFWVWLRVAALSFLLR